VRYSAASTDGTIRLTREPRGKRDRLRAYSILVDGEKAGWVRPGQTVEVPLAQGAHSVRIAIDWARSPPVEVEIDAGEVVDLHCAPNTGQIGLIGVTFGRGRYVLLWREGAADAPRPFDGRLPVPWLRFLTLGGLLAAVVISIATGRVADAVAIALLALLPASLIVGWIVARARE
jgi:hypothetical protein